MKLRVHIDANQVTIDDLIMVDEMGMGVIPARQLKDFLARFIVDDDRKPVPFEQAYEIAGKLTLAELKETFERMKGTIQELQAAAVPPETSGG